MDLFFKSLDWLLPLSLAGAAAAQLVDLRRQTIRHTRLANVLLGVAVALLVSWFALFELTRNRLPLANPAESFGTVALSIALVYALLAAITREHSLGFPLLLAATLARVAASLSPDATDAVARVLHEPWFGFHAMCAILGYTGFTVSAVYSVVFIVLYGNLKNRRFGVMFDRLPSLDVLGRSSIRSATLGFGFLTLAIVAGAFGWSRTLEGPAWRDPKVVSVLLAWIVYGSGVALWYLRGWRGIRAIGITLVAFVIMVLSSWIVPWILGSSHDLRSLT